MKTILVLTLLLLQSCSAMKDFIYAGETHAAMARRLVDHTYDIPLAQTKAKLIEFFEMKHESALIVLPATQNPADGMQYQVENRSNLERKLLDKGFTYKGKIYLEEIDVDWQTIMGWNEKGLAKLKSQIKTGPFNIVEDTPQRFVIVKGLMVYTGEAVAPGKTKLTARELNTLEYDAAKWSMEWGKLLSGKGLGLSLDSGPVSLEKSLPSAKRDALRELALLHFLDKTTFVKWEAEAEKKKS